MSCSPVRVAFALLALTACDGGGGGEPMEDVEPTRPPLLRAMSPSEIRLGEEITILGENFPSADEGRLQLHLKGQFTDSARFVHDYDDVVTLTVHDAGRASFTLDRVIFHPAGDVIGGFHGEARLITSVQSADDPDELEELPSEGKEVSLRVGPSLLVEMLRPVQRGCSDITPATIEDIDLELGIRAIGFGRATEARPWEFRLSFDTPALAVRYIVEDAIQLWPMNGPVHSSVGAEARPDQRNHMTLLVTDGDTLNLNPQTRQDRVAISPAVKIGNEEHRDGLVLQRFATGQVPDGFSETANIIVRLRTSTGREITRVVNYKYFRQHEVGRWNGVEKIVKRYPPEMVDGCIPPHEIGADVSYTEGSSRSVNRRVGARWDAGSNQSLGFTAGHLTYFQINGNQGWSETFSIDVDETVSTEQHRSQSISIRVIPTYSVQKYRHLTQLERSVDLIYHTECGGGGVVGQAVLENYAWAFEVAQGDADCTQETVPSAFEKGQ